MIHGLDTGFLVAAEVLEHPQHVPARDNLAQLIAAEDQIALAPQVLPMPMPMAMRPDSF